MLLHPLAGDGNTPLAGDGSTPCAASNVNWFTTRSAPAEECASEEEHVRCYGRCMNAGVYERAAGRRASRSIGRSARADPGAQRRLIQRRCPWDQIAALTRSGSGTLQERSCSLISEHVGFLFEERSCGEAAAQVRPRPWRGEERRLAERSNGALCGLPEPQGLSTLFEARHSVKGVAVVRNADLARGWKDLRGVVKTHKMAAHRCRKLRRPGGPVAFGILRTTHLADDTSPERALSSS